MRSCNALFSVMSGRIVPGRVGEAAEFGSAPEILVTTLSKPPEDLRQATAGYWTSDL